MAYSIPNLLLNSESPFKTNSIFFLPIICYPIFCYPNFCNPRYLIPQSCAPH